MAPRAPQADPRSFQRRGKPLMSIREFDPFATGPQDIERIFNENNFESLGGLKTKDKRPPRRRQIAQADTGIASDAPPQKLVADETGALVPYVRPTPAPLPPPDILDNAFLAATRLYDNLGLADPNTKLYTDIVARGRTKPITEKDIDQESVKTLRRVVDKKRETSPTRGSIGEEDYRNAGVFDKGLLGMFDYDVDDEGNVTARDTYDFNLSDAGNRARDATVFERLKGMFTNPESYAGYVGMKAVPDLPGRGVPVNINLGSTNPGPAPMNDADFLQGGATVPSGQYRGPQSNAQMKFDQGNPVPFSEDWVSQAWHGMWNAFDQMLRGTVFGAQPGQTTTIPKTPPSVPMPEPNPMFHQMSMTDPAQAAVDQMMAMPHWPQPAAPPSFFGGGETPSVPDINPPVPEKKTASAKPKKVEAKENTEAKRKSSPPTPTRNPRRA